MSTIYKISEIEQSDRVSQSSYSLTLMKQMRERNNSSYSVS